MEDEHTTTYFPTPALFFAAFRSFSLFRYSQGGTGSASRRAFRSTLPQPDGKSANMAEVVSATPPKAPCRALRARFGRGGIPKREGLNALTAAGPSSSVQTEAGNTREPAPRTLVGRRNRLDV